MLAGENGIITQAQRAANETENAARQEEMDLAEIEAAITGKDVPIVQVHDYNPGQLEQEGTDTFIINSIEDLAFFSYDVTNGNTYEGKTVKLGTNLDFNSDKSYVEPDRTDFAQYGYNGPLKQALTSGTGFNPIGEITSTGTKCFYGTFDGNNNAICSLYINIDRDENIRVGLFSNSYGEVKNLGIVNTNITVEGVTTSVGGVTGVSHNNLTNSYVTGNINVTGSYWMPVGGLCGVMQEEANIENCYNLANINATNIKEGWGSADIGCGGIVGQGKANINKCSNKGKIVANGGDNYINIGGICGHLDDGYIKNCYNNAEIEGSGGTTQGLTYIAGIVGGSSVSDIINCYNSGKITGDIYGTRIGGIIGQQRANNYTINNVFNIGEIVIKNQDTYAVGGIVGYAVENSENYVNINNAYNVGIIELNNLNLSQVGSIAGSNLITFSNCFYLKGTYAIGAAGSGTVTGVTELDSIEDFPSVLDVVNGEGAFKEDTEGINNGYPILE